MRTAVALSRDASFVDVQDSLVVLNSVFIAHHCARQSYGMVGLFAKVLVMEVRRLLSPQGAVFVERFNFDGPRTLEEKAARLALVVTVLYLASFGVMALANSLFGYPLDQSLFEAASVIGNSGLSSGLTSATMPAPLKVMYIIGMWAGRMEFMTLLVSFGLIVSAVTRR